MALADNRTQLQDCENVNEVASDSSADPQSNTSESGVVIEGTNALQFQVTNAQEYLAYDQDAAGSTFNLDLSDSTVYLMIKDNLHDNFAGLGAQVVLADTADGVSTTVIGYGVAGYDVIGLPYEKKYSSMKLDVSVIVASPGVSGTDFYQHAGTEANLDQTIIKQVGYGSIHLIKGQGTIPNTFFDGIYYIANDSYAATISGGTVGTPETMLDVVGDDITSGYGMFSNPVGDAIYFFAPTEFGDAGTADSYLTSDGEQWYWLGDNGGGHAVGATHFPMRLIGNATGTNSWVLTGTQIINVGTRSEFDMSDVNFDIVKISGGSLTGVGTIELPDGPDADRFTTDVIFTDCDQITNNGADMDGCSILGSIVAADTGALLYNEASDPDGTLDNLTIEMGAASHHAIDFGTNVDSSLTSITLRGINFNGFGSTDDANDSTLRFLATTGTLTVNLIDCTVDGVSPVASGGGKNFSVDDAAGMTVTVVVQPVTLQITVLAKKTLLPIQNVQTSIHTNNTAFTQLMNEDTTAAGIASESYAGSTPQSIVWRCRKSEDTDNPRYKAQSGIDTITTDGFTLQVLLEENPVLN